MQSPRSCRKSPTPPVQRMATPQHHAFTLIELLVVVAIIALLISILLPSLGQARMQARTTLCTSRISQMGKALMLYAEGFNNTPPFMGRGWEDADDPIQDPLIWPANSGITVRQWKIFEDWLMPNMPGHWAMHSDDWPAHAKVSGGQLFPYARFAGLYTCPEFERITDAGKSQNVFNYTRTLLGRKWFHKNDKEGNSGSPWYFGNWAGAAGPIMKFDQMYSPATLELLFDERWDRHCAGPVDKFIPQVRAGEGPLLEGRLVGQWMVADPMLGIIGDELGQYHGKPMPSYLAPPEYKIPSVKRAGVVYYDGHAGLELDPLPSRRVDTTLGAWEAIGLAVKFLDWVLGHVHGQRGYTEPRVDIPF